MTNFICLYAVHQLSLYTVFHCLIAITGVMPKTPRKNPTPRKLLRLSAEELQRKENEHTREGTEVSQSETVAVCEDSKPELASGNINHSEFGSCASASAVPSVESVIQDKALAGSRRRSERLIKTPPTEGHGIKTSAELSRKGSKRSTGKQKKDGTRSKKLATKDAANCFQTDKPLAVDGDVDLHDTNLSGKHTDRGAAEYCRDVQKVGVSVDLCGSVDSHEVSDPGNSVIVMDSVCTEVVSGHNKPAADLHSVDNLTLSPAACSSSGATETVKGQGSAAAGQLLSLDEPEGVYIPTPQKNQLRFLSEELFSLNRESAHITTHIHRRSGTTPRRDRKHASNNRQSLSTPRKFGFLTSDSRSNSHSPRSTPRKINSGPKTPWKVKFSFSTPPSKSEKKEATKTPSSKKKSPHSPAVLKFPTPNKKQTKRKLYAESPECDTRKPAKVARYVVIF